MRCATLNGMVVGQRDDAGAELDALGAFGGRRQEHLRRGDHLPAGRVVLAAPEFIVAELVEVLREVEVAAELQHRMFADGVMRGQKCAKADAGHEVVLPMEFVLLLRGRKLRADLA